MEPRGVHDDDDAGTDDDDDDDDFTTLSEINEPQKAFALTTSTVSDFYVTSNEPSLTTTIDVDNLIDAIDATAKTTTAAAMPQQQIEVKEQQQHLQLLNVDAVAGNTSNPSSPGDDKSQHLSDIDNESFNSIDFESEITIGGCATKGEATGTIRTVEAGDVETAKSNNTNNTRSNTSENTTIGSFFNNLLTHPSTGKLTEWDNMLMITQSAPMHVEEIVFVFNFN